MAELAVYTETPRVGRPPIYSDELAGIICERLANGESLRSITKEDGMPRQATIFRWLASNRVFSEQYARAREAQADTIADEILFIADNVELGVKTTTKPNGEVETVEFDMTEHRKLRIDTRKWYAGKVSPKKYGNRLEVDSTVTHNFVGRSFKEICTTATDAQFEEIESGIALGKYLVQNDMLIEVTPNVSHGIQNETKTGDSEA